jgi:hypothetical protein
MALPRISRSKSRVVPTFSPSDLNERRAGFSKLNGSFRAGRLSRQGIAVALHYAAGPSSGVNAIVQR